MHWSYIFLALKHRYDQEILQVHWNCTRAMKGPVLHDFDIATDTLYLILTTELWDVYCKQCFTQHTKYLQKTHKLIKWLSEIKARGHFALLIYIYKMVNPSHDGLIWPLFSNIYIKPCRKSRAESTHGSGREGAAVLLPGFAIKWNQVTRQPHLRDLTHVYFEWVFTLPVSVAWAVQF